MAQQFCTKCGERLEPGAKFCTKCGETIKEPIELVDPNSSMRKFCFIISLVMLGLLSFFAQLVFNNIISIRKIFIILGFIFFIVVSTIFEVLTIITFKGAKFKKHFMYYVAMSLLGIECIASVVFLILGIVR